MKALDFEEAMGQLDDEKILEVISAMDHEKAKNYVDSGKRKHLGRTLLLAAVITALLTAAAFAVSYSIHQRRQAEVRDRLQVDEANVQSYVEYETPETADDGVTLLSSIRNGVEQIVYVNISPVEREEAANYPYTAYYFCTIDGGATWLSARPVIDPEGIYSQGGELGAAVLADAYNEETKTLTVSCSIQNSELDKLAGAGGGVELRLVRVDVEAFKSSGLESVPDWLAKNDTTYGSVRIAPIATEMQLVTFEPMTLTDPKTGMEVTILSLELYPTAAVWHLRYEGAEALYSAQSQDELCHLEDLVCQNAVLHFSDGSELAPGGAQTSSVENGVALPSCSWLKAIDIHKLAGVSIGDTELSITR